MSEYEIPIGSLEEQALKRKERLKNLKRKVQHNTSPNSNEAEKSTEKTQLPSIATQLTSNNEDEGNEDSVIKPKNDDIINEMSTQLEILKAPFIVEDIDIQNLAPRKPDWDLKRDVSKKLELLERRTQRAIAEIIRERLRSNPNDIDLQAVNTVGYSSTQTHDPKIVT